MKSKKEYVPLITPYGQRENNIELSVGYTKGGPNWFSGGYIERGYYLYASPCTVTPMTAEDGRTFDTISVEVGKGLKVLLKAVSRQSKKAEAEALALAEEQKQMLLDAVCKRYGLTLGVFPLT